MLKTWNRSLAVGMLVTGALIWVDVGSASAVGGTVRYVSKTGADSGDCTSSPCKTIGYAIGQSAPGNTIDVASGTYRERVVIDRSLTIQGAGSDATFVQPRARGTILTIGKSPASIDVLVSDLTLRFGFALSGSGGGVSSVPRAGSKNRVTLRRVTMSNNYAQGAEATPSTPPGPAFGGGIYNGADSTLVVESSVLTASGATGGSSINGYEWTGGDATGGAIYNAAGGTLSIVHSAVTANSTTAGSSPCCGAGGDAAGGGIYNAVGGTLSIRRSAVSANVVTGGNSSGYGGDIGEGLPGGSASGGGVYNAGTLRVKTTRISDNTAVGGVGGFGYTGAFCPPSGVGGSASGGGISSVGTLVILRSALTGSTVLGGTGGMGTYDIRCSPHGGPGGTGGLGSGGGIKGDAVIANSTIANNNAYGGAGGEPLGGLGGSGGDGVGGAITSGSLDTLINTTIAGNSAIGGIPAAGGSAGSASGGGIDVTGTVTLSNTILAGDSAESGPDCFGAVKSIGHNLLGSDDGCTGFTGKGDLVNVDPLLGPLQDNGGPTYTLALLAGSPAISAAKNSVCAEPPIDGIDQRGLPREPDPHCDIGSYEVQP